MSMVVYNPLHQHQMGHGRQLFPLAFPRFISEPSLSLKMECWNSKSLCFSLIMLYLRSSFRQNGCFSSRTVSTVQFFPLMVILLDVESTQPSAYSKRHPKVFVILTDIICLTKLLNSPTYSLYFVSVSIHEVTLPQ